MTPVIDKKAIAPMPTDDYEAQPAARGPDGDRGNEDANWSFRGDKPAPRELQEAELGKCVPDGQRNGELKEQDKNRDERQRNPPGSLTLQSAATPRNE